MKIDVANPKQQQLADDLLEGLEGAGLPTAQLTLKGTKGHVLTLSGPNGKRKLSYTETEQLNRALIGDDMDVADKLTEELLGREAQEVETGQSGTSGDNPTGRQESEVEPTDSPTEGESSAASEQSPESWEAPKKAAKKKASKSKADAQAAKDAVLDKDFNPQPKKSSAKKTSAKVASQDKAEEPEPKSKKAEKKEPAPATLNKSQEKRLEKLADELAEARNAQTAGPLRVGRVLLEMAEVTSRLTPRDAVKAQRELYDSKFGVRANGESNFPGEAQRSNFKRAYTAWVKNTDLEIDKQVFHENFTNPQGQQVPMTLATVPDYTALAGYAKIVTPSNAVRLLAFLHNYQFRRLASKVIKHFNTEVDNSEELLDEIDTLSEEEFVAWIEARTGGSIDGVGGSGAKSDYATIKVKRETYELFIQDVATPLADYIEESNPNVTPPEIVEERIKKGQLPASMAQIFDAVRDIITMLGPDYVRAMVLNANGALSEDEYEKYFGEPEAVVVDDGGFDEEPEVTSGDDDHEDGEEVEQEDGQPEEEVFFE